MYKWLSILLVVLTGFLIVLLSLGYLLKENEQSVTLLKQKLDQEKATEQQSQQSPLQKHQQKNVVIMFANQAKSKTQYRGEIRQVILQHQTCLSAQQCVLVDTKEKEFGCVVAINTIGAAQLTKIINSSTSGVCDESKRTLTASCQQNMCTLNQ